ncbi:MAG: T9SS type A sorting domain-containing protein [Saprospiraceae bacterium]
MMKLFNISALVLIWGLFSQNLTGQTVPKKTIVEHFTNTRCSICAGRNPGFYTALNQNPDVIHIAYHPSSPYSDCLFSTQNKIQNDARTNFYNIYGATPRFIINGEERNGTQVQSPTVYNEFKNQTTPIDLKVKVAKLGADQIEVTFEAKAVSNNTVGTVFYFIALVEDTVFYNAPNGEKIHHDVFRKSFTNAGLPGFVAPQNEGNLFTLTDSRKIESNWDASRIYAVVVLTDANKKVVQVAKSPLYNPDIVSSIENELTKDESLIIFPNPTSSELLVRSKSNETLKNILIFNATGQSALHLTPEPGQHIFDVSSLENGTYFIQITTENKVSVRKFIKT